MQEYGKTLFILSQAHTCTSTANPTYANLDIAALCGFVSVFLWGANIWFLYKETRQNQGEFPNDLVQDSPTAAGGGYEPYGPGSGMGAGGQWGAGQSSVQGGMNEI